MGIHVDAEHRARVLTMLHKAINSVRNDQLYKEIGKRPEVLLRKRQKMLVMLRNHTDTTKI